ncbi:MAG TPA: hypothetical protein DCZ30_06870, partial [Clostridiales bacterium]|nr:hypothetical protein [Clostridiales bacterium]
VNKSGYLIDIRKIDDDSKNKIDNGEQISNINYDDLKIEKEVLTNFQIKNEDNLILQNENTYESTSALEYYIESYKFTKWVTENLKNIKPKDAIDGNTLEKLKFTINKTIENENIFEINDNNIPENRDSIFYMHKEAVIRKKIENSLMTAIANYNQFSSSNYEFVLPNLKETDWENITTKVCMTSFVQGLSIKGKYYNNYATVVSNTNTEFINKNDLIVLANDGNYHTLNCKELIKETSNNSSFAITAYSKRNLSRQKIKIEKNSTTYYYYPHIVNNTKKNYLNCYKCIANLSEVYSFEQVVNGEITDESGNILYTKEKLNKIRTIYFTSLAREKYDLRK